MRISKFRGYDLAGKRWVFGGYLRHEEIMHAPGQTLPESDFDDVITNDSAAEAQQPRELQAIVVARGSVGEFTGMYSTDGQEVYEHDIVEYKQLTGNDSFEIRRGEVKYADTAARFVVDTTAFDRKPFVYQLGNLLSRRYLNPKIVGNTYNNPEMMEARK